MSSASDSGDAGALAVALASARVAVEEARRDQRETARRLNELASVIVHDLRNPVHGIRMMAEAALRRRDELPERHARYLVQIGQTCREMARVIDTTLHIVQLEGGQCSIRPEPLQLGDLVDAVLIDLGALEHVAERRVRVQLDEDLPAAHADRELLHRVLTNLVLNALRHGGDAEMEIVASAGPGPDEVTCTVRDRGRGIPFERQGHVLERVRVAPRLAADAPGADAGLGLSFCKLAVERMGGRIALRSAPGAGVEVAVSLPAATA